MPNHTFEILLIVTFIWVASCEKRTHFFYLQLLRLSQFLQALPLRVRLEWEIHKIKKDKTRYLEMAKQIQSELTDETNHQ